jgi:RNA polymerase sigma factor (sigma-70 family)
MATMKVTYNPQLIEAACEGDAGAIEDLLRQCSPTITRFARQFCATPEDVEDAVQETLWITAQKIGTLRSASAFVSWVFTIVRNHCYRMLHIKREESPLDKLDQTDASSEQQLMLKQDVVKALEQLPAPQRQVLILRDIEGLTAPEVATMLGITIETVKSRLHRARNALRQSLSHWND